MNFYLYPIGLILTLLIASNLLLAASDNSAIDTKQIRSTQTQPSQQQQQQQQQQQRQPQQSENESPWQSNTLPPLGKPDAAAQAETQRLAATCQTEGQLGPTLVIIPPGQFLMGSDSKTDPDAQPREAPQHWVTIPKPFALSRCEITVGQFRQFVQETRYQTTAETDGKGCYGWDAVQKKAIQRPDLNWQNPGFSQDDHHPVVCISWQDTQHYLDWLSQRTGTRYRLPSEAEWEYAARARTITPHFYQPDQQCAYANGAGQETKAIAASNWTLAQCTDPFVYTAPVASFAENPFGLFDMAGNVWEWTQDCWHDDYTGAPTDGSAWLEKNGGGCTRRVLRGGSWNINPQILRSAFRDRFNPDVAVNDSGFRVARDF